MKTIFKAFPLVSPNTQFFRKENLLFVKGPLGLSCLDISSILKKSLTLNKNRAKYSSFFRLFQKSLLGVRLKFVVRLTFVGVGFRIEFAEKGFIKLKLGFSHLVFVRIPSYINIFVSKKTLLVLNCTDDQLLKEFCSKIKSLKAPDAYKGKGILHKNQTLILKEGKKK